MNVALQMAPGSHSNDSEADIDWVCGSDGTEIVSCQDLEDNEVVMCCASGPGCPNCACSGDGGAGGGVGSGSVAIAAESGSSLGFSTRQPAAAR